MTLPKSVSAITARIEAWAVQKAVDFLAKRNRLVVRQQAYANLYQELVNQRVYLRQALPGEPMHKTANRKLQDGNDKVVGLLFSAIVPPTQTTTRAAA